MIVAVMFVGFGAITASAQQPVVSASDVQYAATVMSGSSGQASLIWQKFLNGYSSANLVADGKFGPLSTNALKVWQASRSLSADGVAGPMSRASAVAQINSGVTMPVGGTYPAGCMSTAGFSVTTGMPCSGGSNLPAGCTSTAGFSPITGAKCDSGSTPTPTGPLAGGFGTISAITQLSQYNNEEVGGGSSDVKVLGFEIEASDDGDIQISAVKLVFDATGNASGDSDRIEDYLDTVSVWQGSTKVGTADAKDFTKSSTGIYSKTVVLSNSIVRAGDKESFYVAVDAINNLDSGDIDSDSWTVGLENVRVVDGSGVTTTDSDSAPAAIEYNVAGDGVGISFVSFSSASNTELKISANNTPDSTTIAVDNTQDTADVVMLEGQMEVEGDSDVWLDEVPFTLTTTGDSPVAMTSNITLVIDGKTFNETVTSTAASSVSITFDDLDLTLSAGDTVDFTVSADLNDLEDTGVTLTDFDAGDQLTVALTTTNRALVIAENEQGDQLTDGTEMTGTATGNAMIFRSQGVNVVLGTPTYTNVSDQNGVVTLQTFTIPVTVTAFGNTLYMGQSAQFATTATASNAFAVVFENSSTPTIADVTSSAVVALSTTDALISSNGYVLDEDDTKHFIIEVTQTTPGLLGAISAGNYRVRLDEIRVFTEAALNTATNIDLVPTTDFRTAFKYITS